LLILLTLLILLAAPSLQAHSAETPPEGVLWTSLSLSAAAAPDTEGTIPPGPLQFSALGFALDYGVLPWASLSALWRPGVLLSAYTSQGPAGSVSDLRFALRLSLLGRQGLIRFNPLRLVLSAGVTAPLPSDPDSAWEPDTHLWAITGGLSLDFIPHQLFQLNGLVSASFFPEQASDNPAFFRQAVSHPLDLSVELEPKLTFLSPGGVILSFPLVYEFSAESSIRGLPLGDEQQLLSLGLGFAFAIREAALPFDLGLRFLAPFYHKNSPRLQRLELTGKIAIPLVRASPEPETP
jgi:hypothetical protein